IKGMIESLPERRQWRLIYAGRSRSTMAFVDELQQRYPDRVEIYARDEQKIDVNLTELLDGTSAQVYCCGPESLMSAVAAEVAPKRMHLERFVAVARTSVAPLGDVQVACRKSKKDFTVPAGTSILSALEQGGIPIMGSCNKGVCGTCEVRVVEGTPIHLDSVMDDAEKNRLRIMYPCVSRATGEKLVLDI
ncbi:MAG: hypothetical protein RIR88_817, partial [Actinomycetota bacterium]